MSSNSTQVWKLIQKYANLGIQGGAFNSIEDTQSIRDTIELLKTGVINQVAKQTIEKMFNSLLKAGIITSCAEAKNIVSLNCSIQKYTPPHSTNTSWVAHINSNFTNSFTNCFVSRVFRGR